MLLNADGAQLPNQIRAARDAGVRRILVTISLGGASDTLNDVQGLQRLLEESGITYTVIRTGELSNDVLGAPMRIDSVDTPSCAELSRDDAFRVAMEALTIPAANNKMFSLCPAEEDETKSVYREMRFAGADRRQEVVALIKGAVEKRQMELKEKTEKEQAVAAGKVEPEGDPEVAKAKEADDVQAAFQRAAERAKRVAEEEAEKERLLEEKRKERAKTQDAIDERIKAKKREQGDGDDDEEGGDGKDGDGGDGSDGESKKPDEPPLATL